ncbi:unnamed protein product, partial [Prorocentrum cordatum]
VRQGRVSDWPGARAVAALQRTAAWPSCCSAAAGARPPWTTRRPSWPARRGSGSRPPRSAATGPRGSRSARSPSGGPSTRPLRPATGTAPPCAPGCAAGCRRNCGRRRGRRRRRRPARRREEPLPQRGRARERRQAHRHRRTPHIRSLAGEFKDACSADRLRSVLRRFAAANADIGYVQSLNFLAGILVLVLGADEHVPAAMGALVALLRARQWYAEGMEQLRADALVLRDLLQERTHDFEPLLVTPKWFLSLFSIRGEALLRAWDAVLADGIEAAFRIGLALFARREEETIVRADAIDDIAALFLSPQGEVPPDVLLAAAYHKSLLGSGIDKSELEKRRCRALSKISSSDSNSPGGGLMAKRAMVPYLFARGTRDLMDAGRKERGGSEGYKFGDMSRGIASRVESKLKERAAATASVASPAASHRGCRQRSAAASAAARPASGPPARAGSAPRRPGARAPPGPRRWWARGGTAIARCGSQRRASPRRAGPPSCASRSAWCGAAGRCLECCAKRATGTSGPRWRTARKRWAPCACGSATTRGCWWPASGRPARPCGARTLSQAGWRSGLTDREFAAQMEDMPDRRVGRSHRPRRPPRHRSAWAPPPPAPRGVARARVPTPNTNRCIRHVRRAALRRS